ncbi:DUF3185 family protein [Thermodesulfobacteriota bacterium]
MAKNSKSTMKILGIALAIIGVGLAFWGYQISGAIGSQISKTITGSHTDKVMMLYIGGAVSFVFGIYLYIKK